MNKFTREMLSVVYLALLFVASDLLPISPLGYEVAPKTRETFASLLQQKTRLLDALLH